MNMSEPSRRQNQVSEHLAHLAGEFFARESNRESLITVTRADVSADLHNATIFISVLPETAEEKALAFAKRERSALRDFVKSRVAFSSIPTFDVEIDYGEKNRQRISALV